MTNGNTVTVNDAREDRRAQLTSPVMTTKIFLRLPLDLLGESQHPARKLSTRITESSTYPQWVHLHSDRGHDALPRNADKCA